MLAGSQSHPWSNTHRDTCSHSHRLGLFGSCPRPCYETSLGKQQGPWTGHWERSRERKSKGLLSRDKIPLFFCLILSLLLAIHPFHYHQPFLSYFFINHVKLFQSKPGQGRMSAIVKSPYFKNQTLNARSGNSAVLETNWLYMNNVWSRSAQRKKMYSWIWK